MTHLAELIENNRTWAAGVIRRDPGFFSRLRDVQTPRYMWIGCADSRVPANEIVGLLPGEMFVHRNVANVVVHTDLNCLSVLQYAVDVLQIRDIIVCGHYGCGGIHAAATQRSLGLIDNWLRHVQDVAARHEGEFSPSMSPDARANRLCELNVLEQALNVCQTTVIREAWLRHQPVTVHGWIYSLEDGLVRSLNFDVASAERTVESYRNAIQSTAPVRA
jgi:carbonic anhydrase